MEFVEDKTTLREEIGEAVAAFLASGGEIDRQPILVRGADEGIFGTMARMVQQSADARKAAKAAARSNADKVPPMSTRPQYDGYLNGNQLAGIIGYAKSSTVRKLVKDGKFPQPCKIGWRGMMLWRADRVQGDIERVKANRGKHSV